MLEQFSGILGPTHLLFLAHSTQARASTSDLVSARTNWVERHKIPVISSPAIGAQLFDVYRLAYCLAVWVQNQDLIVCGHHRDPAGSKSHRLGCGAGGQGDFAGQGGAICRQADDKQADNQYKPANHHHSQCGHQSTQEFQLRRFVLDFRLGRISHGQPPD